MNKEPIQKEEVKVIATPSDTFIEEILKEFETYYCLSSIMDVESQNEIKQFLIKALQEQRQSILEEIEKRERRIKESLPSLTNINKGYNQALEDIKQII